MVPGAAVPTNERSGCVRPLLAARGCLTPSQRSTGERVTRSYAAGISTGGYKTRPIERTSRHQRLYDGGVGLGKAPLPAGAAARYPDADADHRIQSLHVPARRSPNYPGECFGLPP